MIVYVSDNSLTDNLKNFLNEVCGYKISHVDRLDRSTRLFYDLNIYGDIAESCLEEFVKEFGVDVSLFNFEDYFPFEFDKFYLLDIWLIFYIPYLRKKYFNDYKYKDLTLGDLEGAIKTKVLA